MKKSATLTKNVNTVKKNVIPPPLRERQLPPYNVYNKPLTKIKINIICRIISAIIICTVCLCPVAYAEQITSDTLLYPTLGLYCADADSIIGGSERIYLTDEEQFARGKAIKQSQYTVSGNGTAVFEIPFYSSYAGIPTLNVTVDGKKICGEVWYGNYESSCGNSAYSDNSVIKYRLTYTYPSTLADSVVGTLYTLTPVADTMSVKVKLNDKCGYIYDDINRVSVSSAADGAQIWQYDNALSRNCYHYFFACDSSYIDFSADCGYKMQTMTLKEFIDRGYDSDLEYYKGADIDIGCIYATANRMLSYNMGMTYNRLFYPNLSKVALNSYKFSIELQGTAIISYSSEMSIQVYGSYDPPVYIMVHKQLGDFKTDYTLFMNSRAPYILTSSEPVEKNGTTYTASSTGDFLFLLGSSETAGIQAHKLNRKQVIICIVFGIVGGIAVIVAIVSAVLDVRYRRRYK